MAPDYMEIRQLYLEKLMGKKLSPEEQEKLSGAKIDPRFKSTLADLEEVYKNPEMKQLLMERPTSARWLDFLESISAKEDKMGRITWSEIFLIAIVLLLVVATLAFYAMVMC